MPARVSARRAEPLCPGSRAPRGRDALHSRGVDIDRKKLEVPDSIKSLGEYEITAKFGSDVNAKFKVRVLPL